MENPEVDPLAIETPAKPKPYSLGWLWPAITNEEEAKKAARSGVYAAIFVAVLTCAVSLVAIGMKEPFLGMDGWGIIDGLLFAVIAWRISRFSFPWGLVGLLLYFAETYWRWSKVGIPKGGGIITTGLIFMALIAGVRGTAFLKIKE